MALLGADDAVWASVKLASEAMNIADCWPTTIPMPATMIAGTGGPFTVGEAAGKWFDAAGKLQAAQQGLVEHASAVPRDYWSGADRDNFDREISDLAAEIGDSHNYAEAVAITLTGLTVPLGLWPAMAVTISVIEIAEAVAFYAAVASVVGDFGPAEAIYAEGEAMSLSCSSVLDASVSVMIAVMAAGTAAIAVSDAADLGAQAGHGDTGALTDFTKAAIDSSAEVALTVALSREPGEPGRHEAAAPGRHRAEPGPVGKVLGDEDLRERAKDRAGETVNHYGTTPILKAGVDAVIPDGYPDPDDENWGADGPEG